MKTLQDLLTELQDRYDGAEDSTTLWMGEYITALEHAIANPYAEFLAGLRHVREAADTVGVIKYDAVWCDRVGRETDGKYAVAWRMSMLVPNSKKYFHTAESQTIEVAIATMIAGVKAELDVCQTRGGKMSGPCKHSREGV